MGEGRADSSHDVNLRTLPISADLFEPRCYFAARPSRFHTVRLWQCFHHGGHFDVDVFRHRRPRLPFLHHLLAVMILLGHTGGRRTGQRGMCVFPVLHPWFPSRTS